MNKIRVLVVDDAVVIRRLVSDALGADPRIEVAATAANGKIALARIPQINPDLVTLDIEMPEMDGLTTLREIRKAYPRLPVIMFSTLTARGAASTLDALAAGANDYVTKPANVGSIAAALTRIREDLIPRIKSLCDKSIPVPTAATAPALHKPAVPCALAPASINHTAIEAVVIGISTGGPNALAELIPALPADLAASVFIVQHMPPIFTRLLAERLDQQSPLHVKEASHGEAICPQTVYIAPGDFHMSFDGRGAQLRIELTQGPPENSCRPAVDVLFRSAAATFGPATLGVVMTGMGQDGLRGSEAVQKAGGRIIAQDEATSVVWGMPEYVARAGLADELVPLGELAMRITQRVSSNRPRRACA